MRKLKHLALSLIAALAVIQLAHAETLEFSVSLTSNPPAKTGGFVDIIENLKVGDEVTINRKIEQTGVVNNSWDWQWDKDHVDCKAYPEFDSPDLKCTMKKEGGSTISITMYPEMKDGTKRTVTSNLIKFEVSSSTEDMLFSVSIKSRPAATTGQYGHVYAKNGEEITFTRTIDVSEGVVNNAWEWMWNKDHLDCKAYPEFDSPDLKCTVKDENLTSAVHIRMHPEMKDGTKRLIDSNLITVKKGDDTPENNKETEEKNTKEPVLKISDINFYPAYQGEKNVLVFKICNQGAAAFNMDQYGSLSLEVKINGQKDGMAFNENIAVNKCIELKRSNINSTVYSFKLNKTGYYDLEVIIDNQIGNQKKASLSKKIYVIGPDIKVPETITNNDGTSAPAAGYEEEVIVNHKAYNNPFPDTKIDTLEGKAASELFRRAVIGGFPDGEFKGARDVNRAEAAKFLLLARYGTIDEIKNSNKFPDVKEGEWYVKYVVTAANKLIINGYPDGFFRPQNNVKIVEFLKMLTLTFNLETNLSYSYEDVNEGEWFAKYAGVAEKYNLFPERKNKLNPGENLSRKEVAIAIYQYLSNR